MTHIHREGLMFKWGSKNYEIIVGFKRVERSKCRLCGKTIPVGSNICNDCFEKEKKISKK